MKRSPETGNPNVDVFDRDAAAHAGYLYTATDRLSSRLAVDRNAAVILHMAQFGGRRVLDVGCGDGFSTIRYWDSGQVGEMVGVDGAAKAIEVANANKRDRPIQFAVADMHAVPYPDSSFDVVLLQGVLHHDEHADAAIREAFRLAPEVVILEPNGNNPGLKVIEKVSPYHREHNEKSYSPRQLRRWIEEAGGTVLRERFAGFVAMFSPDWLARGMKRVEPLVEGLPLVNAVGCAVYVVVAARET